jgi:hypothetical protein
VLRKLCSALSTYFIHFSDQWPRCLRHMIHCLNLGHSVAYEDSAAKTSSAEQSMAGLTLAKLQAALWLASALAEDVGKVDSNTPKQ